MLLSLRRNFLFVHIAKTGGTSIRAALERQRWREPWALARFVCGRLSALSGHRLGIKLPRHARVIAAREVQSPRFHKTRIYANAHMPPKLVKQHCAPSPEAQRLLEAAMERLGLSARAYHRILKIARTIADLEEEHSISPAHVAEAIQYRTMDRKFG